MIEPLKTEANLTLRRFGLFELDLQANELRKRGLKVKLQDQPLNLLRVLLEKPGEVVSRETLRERLWTPDTFVEFDHSLNTAMMRLREVLGDNPDNPTFIETVPRRGYRFIAPLRDGQKQENSAAGNMTERRRPESTTTGATTAGARTSEPQTVKPGTGKPGTSTPGTAAPESSEPLPGLSSEPSATALPLETSAPRLALSSSNGHAIAPEDDLSSAAVPAAAPHRYRLWITIGILAALLAAAAISAVLSRQQRRTVADGQPVHPLSLVVLPMQNLSGEKSQDYFADGMTDELIASLARISSLRVISRTTAMEYKDTHKSLEKIAQELRVDAVVEGTVLRSGDRVRITAELVQVSTDRHLWADTYEGPVGDILALQNHVASAIVREIRIQLTPQDKQRLAANQTVNPAAYEDYLKGRYYWGKRSQEGLLKAIQYFQSATEEDPQYALAYAGLADCYGILGAAIVGTVPTSEVAQKAERAASRAVELDATLAETQTALATVEFNYNWNWLAAESGFRRAIELNPNYATAHQRYSLYLTAMGRKEESLAEMNLARSLDPLSLSMNFSLGWRLYMAGQYDQAIAQLRNTIEMDPTFVLARIVLGQSLEQKKEYGQAIAELQRASALSHDSPPVIAALGHAYAVAGRRSEALGVLRELQAQSTSQYVAPFYVALVYVGLDDRAQAMKWLNKAYDDRSNSLIFLKADPQFAPLRLDPAFQDLLHRVGF